MLCMDAYEDPYWQSNTKLQNDSFRKTADGQVLERLVDPDSAHKTQEGGALRYTQETDNSVTPSIGGRWWPVWLVGKTETGWWTICWYQILDGTWIALFWWYADVHIHLLDARL